MKCFLHIGTEKTATTTLQTFMDLNRAALLKEGFIYTRSAGKANNIKLALASYNPSRRDNLTKWNGIHSDAELTAFNRRLVSELTGEIKRLTARHPKASLIFSSEHFQSRLTTLEEIARLRDILRDFGVSDISVVVYLRNPAEIANSLFSTAVKTGSLQKQPPPPQNPYYANVCNHKNTLTKFTAVFGEQALVPRLFDRHEFINGSIIDDFLTTLGVPLDRSYVTPTNANESLSATGVGILMRINRLIPIFIDDKPNPLRADLVSYMEKHYSDTKYIMPTDLYEKYDAAFRESNEWVRMKYFPDRRSLFSKTSPPEETRCRIPDDELDRLAGLIADMWSDKQKQIIRLRKHTKRALNQPSPAHS